MERLDEAVFLALNFDGGSAIDQAMFFVSGKLTWLPLYLLIIFLIWRRYGWRTTLFAVLLIAAAVGAADQICNLFKNGLQMLRPNHDADVTHLMHFPLKNGEPYVNKGLYGTVSAHAATVVALAWMSALMIRRRWYNWLIAVSVVLICYSRIYLACHFPMDLLLGTIVGTVTGVAMYFLWRKLDTILKSF